MADILYGGGNNIGTFSDVDSPGSAGSGLDTGDLRRKFNFGDRVSELALAQDPFFRFVSMASKKPTDDPSFKFTERRGSWNKRYAYVMGHVANGSDSFADAELDQSDTAAAVSAVDQNVKLYMAGDYKTAGNIQNVYGQASGKIDVGDAGTAPAFFIPGQIVKVPMSSTDQGGATTNYHLVKVTAVSEEIAKDGKQCVQITGKIVKFGTDNELATFNSDNFSPGNAAGDEIVHDQDISGTLEGKRSYVVGTTFDKGTGYPEAWKDQPFSTGFGQTQIWKTAMVMDNTDRATSLKYESNEWARLWKEKLIEHKYDIEQSLLFGSQSETYRTTQGAVDWVLNNGNIFTLATATKSQDDFLDDLSNYLDPRYNNAKATVFFCSTAVYNWVHKLSGYFANNLGKVVPGQAANTVANSSTSFGRADLAMTGRKKVLGLDSTTISTVYGDINMVRNIHLDGTNISMLGVDMKHCAYRPLVGNGINRDTSVYVGVQTLENSGVDRRVDQILTEAGMEFNMPEAHAIWKNA